MSSHWRSVDASTGTVALGGIVLWGLRPDVWWNNNGKSEKRVHVGRWAGYLGDPIRPEQILYDSPHSLIEQSRHAVKGLVTEEGTVPAPFTNGDGFGLGWYGHREQPGLYRNVMPAWGDPNLRDIAGQ